MKGYGQGWRAGFRQSKALTERQTRERSTNFTSPNMSCEVTASLGYLPFAPRRARRLDWVGLRRSWVAFRGAEWVRRGRSQSGQARPPSLEMDLCSRDWSRVVRPTHRVGDVGISPWSGL